MYNFKIKKTYHYYGYPQAEYHYEISGAYFTAKVKYYGNQGFDCPQISSSHKNNGYFWSMRSFMKAFFNDELRRVFLDLKENETTNISLE